MFFTLLMVLVTLKGSASFGTTRSVRFLNGSNSGMMDAKPFSARVWHEYCHPALHPLITCIQVP